MVNFVITNGITTNIYTKNDDNNVDSNNRIDSNDGMIHKTKKLERSEKDTICIIIIIIYLLSHPVISSSNRPQSNERLLEQQCCRNRIWCWCCWW